MKEAMQLFVTGKEQIELQADRWPEAPLGVDQVEGETVVGPLINPVLARPAIWDVVTRTEDPL